LIVTEFFINATREIIGSRPLQIQSLGQRYHYGYKSQHLPMILPSTQNKLLWLVNLDDQIINYLFINFVT